MSEPEPIVSSLGFTAVRLPWTLLRVGFKLSDIFALGLTADNVVERLKKRGFEKGRIAFTPELAPVQVRDYYRAWIAEDPARSEAAKAHRRAQRKPRQQNSEPKKPSRVPRKCLCCPRSFLSWGIGHRICDACKQSTHF